MRRLASPLSSSGRATGRPPLLWRGPKIAAALVPAAIVGVALGVALHHGHPSATTAPPPAPRLPLLSGVVDWARGQRAAPDLVLRDSQGAALSLATQRGRLVLIAFLDSLGGDLAAREARALATTEALVDGRQRPTVDVVSLQPGLDSRSHVQAVARRWGLSAGAYRWLVGPRAALERLRHVFGIDAASVTRAALARRAIYLIDGGGWERAGYLFPFPPTVLARDLRTLAAQG